MDRRDDAIVGLVSRGGFDLGKRVRLRVPSGRVINLDIYINAMHEAGFGEIITPENAGAALRAIDLATIEDDGTPVDLDLSNVELD